MRFIVRRSKEAALGFTRRPKRFPLPPIKECLPLFVFINTNILHWEEQENMTGSRDFKKRKKKSGGIVSEARAVSVHLQLLPYSSRWDLTWNTLTLWSPLTHLTSIRDSDGGERFWGDFFFRLSHKKEGKGQSMKKKTWICYSLEGFRLCGVAKHLQHVQISMIFSLENKVAVRFFHLVLIPRNYTEGPFYSTTEKVAQVWAKIMSPMGNWVANE